MKLETVNGRIFAVVGAGLIFLSPLLGCRPDTAGHSLPRTVDRLLVHKPTGRYACTLTGSVTRAAPIFVGDAHNGLLARTRPADGELDHSWSWSADGKSLFFRRLRYNGPQQWAVSYWVLRVEEGEELPFSLPGPDNVTGMGPDEILTDGSAVSNVFSESEASGHRLLWLRKVTDSYETVRLQLDVPDSAVWRVLWKGVTSDGLLRLVLDRSAPDAGPIAPASFWYAEFRDGVQLCLDQIVDVPEDIRNAAVSPDGTLLAAIVEQEGYGQEIILADVTTGSAPRRLTIQDQDRVHGMQFSPQGDQLLLWAAGSRVWKPEWGWYNLYVAPVGSGKIFPLSVPRSIPNLSDCAWISET